MLPNIARDLRFLLPYKIDREFFPSVSDTQILVQKYFLTFKQWKGTPIPNTYNGKAVIDWGGEPVFAELAVLRLFQANGWSGVWVDSFRKKYRVGLPGVIDPVDIPASQRILIDNLRSKTGRYGGCWDVVVWKDDAMLFLELKRRGKDRIQQTQIEWLDAALAYGLRPEHFALVEWSLE